MRCVSTRREKEDEEEGVRENEGKDKDMGKYLALGLLILDSALSLVHSGVVGLGLLIQHTYLLLQVL